MQRPNLIAIQLALLLAAPSASAWEADVVSALDILDASIADGQSADTVEFVSRDGVRLLLDLDPAQLELSNPHAADRFYPITATQVRQALSELRPLEADRSHARIYCLPGLPREPRSSFTVGGEVFLAPGLGELSDEVIAYTVTHELGHVIQNAYMPGRLGRAWLSYLSLRGLDVHAHNEESAHRDRPGEIFAEDFRALFGGPAATISGTLENPALPWPTEVDGLEDFFRLLPETAVGHAIAARSFNFPNPFNPSTTIHAELPDSMLVPGARVEISIYDMRGRRVRTLPPLMVAPSLSVAFHGRDDHGARLASGRYLYEIRVGVERVHGSMTLLQ